MIVTVDLREPVFTKIKGKRQAANQRKIKRSEYPDLMQSIISKYRTFCLLLLALTTIMVYHGCDASLDPIQENDQYYSIFGYLDASADTQFVRIELLRDSMFTGAPSNINAEVTLTNTTTGQSSRMQDSVFSYADGKAHNYYTTMDIEPNEMYRLEVNGQGGSSSAEVQIPGTFPKPVLVDDPEIGLYVEVKNIDRLVGVKLIYNSCVNCICEAPPPPPPCPEDPFIREMDFYYLPDTTNFSSQEVRVPIDSLDDREVIAEEYPPSRDFTITNYELMVAAGTDQWPDFMNLSDEALAIPDVASNVEGGTGFLGGIVSDTLTIGSESDYACRACPEY